MPTMIAPPSAPLLGMTPPEASPVPLLEDDIADPEVPASLQEALKAQEGPQEAPGATQVAGQADTTPAPSTPAVDPTEALQHGFLSAVIGKLQDEQQRLLEEMKTAYRDYDRCVARTWEVLEGLVKRASEANEHATYQLANSLTTLQQQGLALRQDPYQVTLEVRSPGKGFPLTFHLAERDEASLMQAVIALVNGLVAQGFTAPAAEQG